MRVLKSVWRVCWSHDLNFELDINAFSDTNCVHNKPSLTALRRLMNPNGLDTANARAEDLSSQASELIRTGETIGAHRKLQEAAHLAPDNAVVKDAFARLQIEDDEHPLTRLCRRYIVDGQEDAGKDAIKYLNSPQKLSSDVAAQSFEIIVRSHRGKDTSIQDGILAALLRSSKVARAQLASRLKDGNTTTTTFETIYNIGEGAAASLATVVLSADAWDTENERKTCEEDVFRLFLAKFIEAGDDDNARAMRGISRLLATDATLLEPLIDEDIFEAILSSLDYRNPIETKSPATLAVAKYLEASGDKGQILLTKYVTTHYARPSTQDMILAFSVAAAVFPIATPIAASMFMTPGFLPSLVPLLEKKTHSEKVEIAALEMLSAACVDSACREAIAKHCIDWVKRISKIHQGQKSTVAAVVLSKLQDTEPKHTATLVDKLTQLLFEDPKGNRNSAFEGLAHQSVRASVKETLINDRSFLRVFLTELQHTESQSPTMFGGLVILDNLTAYLPVLSEEQKRIAQLKAYANATPSAQKDPDNLDQDAAVSGRCQILVEAGMVPVLAGMVKNLSPSCTSLVLKIFLAIAKTPKLRGTIVQQGGVKLLITIFPKIDGSSPQSAETRKNAAHALARLLISVDPSILFGPSGNALLQSTITPLTSLLSTEDASALDGPRDLLPTFEALLALTNLCSLPSNGATPSVLKAARQDIEDLILNNNVNVRRAAMELMSNMVQHHDGIVLFADGSPQAKRRLHILLALAGAEDLGTRKAAGGALATLTEFKEVVGAIGGLERGVELLVAVVGDEEEEVVHRGVAGVVNVLVSAREGEEVCKVFVGEMRRKGLVEKLKGAMGRCKTAEVKGLVREALRMLDS